MRCPECGYEMGISRDELTCPECGTCSEPEQRLPLPPVRLRRVFLGYVGVPIACSTMGVLAGVASESMNRHSKIPVGMYRFALLGGIAVAGIAGFKTTRRLMWRLPRRTVSAPMLLLIPRDVFVPLLAAAATGLFAATLVTGACLAIGFVTAMSGFRLR